MTLHRAIPAITNLDDKEHLRSILEALRQNILVLGGELGNSDKRALLVEDLKNTGQLGEDRGTLYGKNILDEPDLTEQGDPGNVIGAWLDFEAEFSASNGVAIGEYGLGSLPENAYIMAAWIEVVTLFTSPTSNSILGISFLSDWDIYDDAQVDHASYSVGVHQCKPNGLAGTFLGKTTSATSIRLTVGTEPLTAGLLKFYAKYAVTQ